MLPVASSLLKALVTAPALPFLVPSGGEPPEAWAQPVEEGFAYTGAIARMDLGNDLHRYIASGYDQAREKFTYQRDDLLALVRQHYTCRIDENSTGVFWSVPRGVIARWHDRGVLGPQTPARPLRQHLGDIVEAARVSDVLDAQTSYGEMRKLARDAGPVEPSGLAWSLATRTLTEAVESLSLRHGGQVAQAAADIERAAILGVLSRTSLNRRRATFERMARKLTDLTQADDWGREWERAAVTVTRYAVNVSTLVHLHDKHARYVAYTVHPQACKHCKSLLLWPDGAPRCFEPASLLGHLAEDGGLNIGRKAGLPEEAGGWRVALVQHPWCRCRLRRATREEVKVDRARRTGKTG